MTRDGVGKSANLGECWKRWTAFVELLAWGRSTRGQMEPEQYHAIYDSLLEACRAQASTAEEAKRALVHRMEKLVEPWLTLKSLAQADPPTLIDLLSLCRQYQSEFEGRRAWRRIWRPAMLVLAFLTTFALAVWLLGSGSLRHQSLLSVAEWTELHLNEARFTVKELSFNHWLFIVGTVGILLAMRIVRRSARSY